MMVMFTPRREENTVCSIMGLGIFTDPCGHFPGPLGILGHFLGPLAAFFGTLGTPGGPENAQEGWRGLFSSPLGIRGDLDNAQAPTGASLDPTEIPSVSKPCPAGVLVSFGRMIFQQQNFKQQNAIHRRLPRCHPSCQVSRLSTPFIASHIKC